MLDNVHTQTRHHQPCTSLLLSHPATPATCPPLHQESPFSFSTSFSHFCSFSCSRLFLSPTVFLLEPPPPPPSSSSIHPSFFHLSSSYSHHFPLLLSFFLSHLSSFYPPTFPLFSSLSKSWIPFSSFAYLFSLSLSLSASVS